MYQQPKIDLSKYSDAQLKAMINAPALRNMITPIRPDDGFLGTTAALVRQEYGVAGSIMRAYDDPTLLLTGNDPVFSGIIDWASSGVSHTVAFLTNNTYSSIKTSVDDMMEDAWGSVLENVGGMRSASKNYAGPVPSGLSEDKAKAFLYRINAESTVEGRQAILEQVQREAADRETLSRAGVAQLLMSGLVTMPLNEQFWIELFLAKRLAKSDSISRLARSNHIAAAAALGSLGSLTSSSIKEAVLHRGQFSRTAAESVRNIVIETAFGAVLSSAAATMGTAYRSAVRNRFGEETIRESVDNAFELAAANIAKNPIIKKRMRGVYDAIVAGRADNASVIAEGDKALDGILDGLNQNVVRLVGLRKNTAWGSLLNKAFFMTPNMRLASSELSVANNIVDQFTATAMVKEGVSSGIDLDRLKTMLNMSFVSGRIETATAFKDAVSAGANLKQMEDFDSAIEQYYRFDIDGHEPTLQELGLPDLNAEGMKAVKQQAKIFKEEQLFFDAIAIESGQMSASSVQRMRVAYKKLHNENLVSRIIDRKLVEEDKKGFLRSYEEGWNDYADKARPALENQYTIVAETMAYHALLRQGTVRRFLDTLKNTNISEQMKATLKERGGLLSSDADFNAETFIAADPSMSKELKHGIRELAHVRRTVRELQKEGARLKREITALEFDKETAVKVYNQYKALPDGVVRATNPLMERSVMIADRYLKNYLIHSAEAQRLNAYNNLSLKAVAMRKLASAESLDYIGQSNRLEKEMADLQSKLTSKTEKIADARIRMGEFYAYTQPRRPGETESAYRRRKRANEDPDVNPSEEAVRLRERAQESIAELPESIRDYFPPFTRQGRYEVETRSSYSAEGPQDEYTPRSPIESDIIDSFAYEFNRDLHETMETLKFDHDMYYDEIVQYFKESVKRKRTLVEHDLIEGSENLSQEMTEIAKIRTEIKVLAKELEIRRTVAGTIHDLRMRTDEKVLGGGLAAKVSSVKALGDNMILAARSIARENDNGGVRVPRDIEGHHEAGLRDELFKKEDEYFKSLTKKEELVKSFKEAQKKLKGIIEENTKVYVPKHGVPESRIDPGNFIPESPSLNHGNYLFDDISTHQVVDHDYMSKSYGDVIKELSPNAGFFESVRNANDIIDPVILTSQALKSRLSSGEISLDKFVAAMEREVATKAPSSGAKRNKLIKERQAAVDALTIIHDRIFGKHGVGAESVFSTASSVLRKFNYITVMGQVTLSSLPDVAMGLFTSGFGPYVSSTYRYAFHLVKRKFSSLPPDERYAFADLIYAMEVQSSQSRINQAYDLMSPEGTQDFSRSGRSFGGKLEDLADRGASKMTQLNLLARWNGFWKGVNATAGASRVGRVADNLAAGKRLGKGDRRFISTLKLSDKDLKDMHKLATSVGSTEKGVVSGKFYYMNSSAWEGRIAGMSSARVSDLRSKLHAAMSMNADLSIITPGAGSIPGIATSSEVGRSVLQFKRYFFAATENLTYPLVQRLSQGDVQSLNTMAGLMMAGTLVTAAKDAMRGSNPFPHISGFGQVKEGSTKEQYWNNVNALMVNAVDRSGMLGFGSEGLNLLSKSGFDVANMVAGGSIGRAESRSIEQLIAGPSVGTIETMKDAVTSIIGLATGSEPLTGAATRDIRRLSPFQNLLPVTIVADGLFSFFEAERSKNRYNSIFNTQKTTADFYYDQFKYFEHRLAPLFAPVDYSKYQRRKSILE